ncbi:CHASE2 domain-containing sensor protein [Catenuloplanes nepalensis]|uniref:CHASE2 domain-containing sensor protein n=1 Tax=Catenuloplanes nepalensis TaxID=587533 RepID=A0ABT9MRH3_9ACTN|nr:DoxX family protein [Catenuloplanes nepalensis]MDP9794033.1 CHASE2 domain-containing sensor protein [Catenuloplanes nepalensis]
MSVLMTLTGTILCILANGFEVAAKLAGAEFVLRNSAEVGVPARWIPYLAAIEAAGVAGLVAGLLGARLVGLAAAAGLVAFFVGAVAAHVRARVFHNVAFPAAFLVLALTAVVHFG